MLLCDFTMAKLLFGCSAEQGLIVQSALTSVSHNYLFCCCCFRGTGGCGKDWLHLGAREEVGEDWLHLGAREEVGEDWLHLGAREEVGKISCFFKATLLGHVVITSGFVQPVQRMLTGMIQIYQDLCRSQLRVIGQMFRKF